MHESYRAVQLNFQPTFRARAPWSAYRSKWRVSCVFVSSLAFNTQYVGMLFCQHGFRQAGSLGFIWYPLILEIQALLQGVWQSTALVRNGSGNSDLVKRWITVKPFGRHVNLFELNGMTFHRKAPQSSRCKRSTVCLAKETITILRRTVCCTFMCAPQVP